MPFAFGKSTPTRSPGLVSAASRRPRMRGAEHEPVVADRLACQVLGDRRCRRRAWRAHPAAPRTACGRSAWRGTPCRPAGPAARDRAPRGADARPSLSAGSGDRSTGGMMVTDRSREPPHRQLALHPAKPRELQAVDADGQNLRARLVGDDARALIDLHQRAGLGQPPFGKDHQLAPVIAHRLDHVLDRIGRLHIHLEDVDGGEERPRPPLPRLRVCTAKVGLSGR